MAWATLISNKAMEVVEAYETRAGRDTERKHTRRVGYDIRSFSASEERYIEVKGVSERWSTYTWQSLHCTEYDCLKENPEKFFLYIVYFDIKPEERNEETLMKTNPSIYIIPGKDLLRGAPFPVERASYAVKRISKEKLGPYRKG